MKILWDEYKNIANQIKHGISFEEAEKVFSSEFILLYDDKHSTLGEDRYKAIGKIDHHGVIVVIHTEVFEITRIISARKAEKHEVDLWKNIKL